MTTFLCPEIEALTEKQSCALSQYYSAVLEYRGHIGDIDEDAHYIGMCNVYDNCQRLGVPKALMEV